MIYKRILKEHLKNNAEWWEEDDARYGMEYICYEVRIDKYEESTIGLYNPVSNRVALFFRDDLEDQDYTKELHPEYFL